MLSWTARDLASAAGIHQNTVSRFEVGRYAGTPATLAAIKKALEEAGVEFTNDKRPGVEDGLALIVTYPPTFELS
jgi:transcriptional regulator with XRE-family HTH domain